jgi:DNA (cytosine-5)-methyltransferase 1
VKCVSLFAGIGGFDLGFQRAGIETVALVERDARCRKLLSSKFPSAAIHDDVRTVGKHNLPSVDIVVGGFPCQDVSIAGPRHGLAGSRSGLYYQLTRITNELSPSFLIWENVPGLLSSNDGRDFLAVLVELDRIGYYGAWRVLDAQYIGVAQRRRRVFGCFARRDIGAERCAEILSLSEGVRGHPAPSRKARQSIAGTLTRSSIAGGSAAGGDGRENFLVPEVANCLEAQRRQRNNASHETWLIDDPIAFSSKDSGLDAGPISPTLRSMSHDRSHMNGGGQVAVAFALRGREDGALPEVNGDGESVGTLRDASEVSLTLSAEADGDNATTIFDGGVRRMTPIECERLQGFPDGWTSAFSDSTRYKMLGNAVATTVAEWIGRRVNR